MFELSLFHLKVVLDFVLEEVRVFFQGLSELRNALVDLQQLDRVAAMVPRRGHVLSHRKNQTVIREKTN